MSRLTILGVLAMAFLLAPVGAQANEIVGHIIDNNVNCRSEPEFGDNVVAELFEDDEVTLTLEQSNDFYEVTLDSGINCWVSREYLYAPVAGGEQSWIDGWIIDYNVNCRSEPSMESAVKYQLNHGASVTIYQGVIENNFQKVLDQDGIDCWVFAQYVSSYPPDQQIEADKPILEIPIDMPVGEYVSETATGPSKHISEYEVVYTQPQETNSGTVTGLPNTGGSEKTPFVNGAIVGLAVSILLVMAAAAVIATRRGNRQQATTSREWEDFSSPQHGITPPGSFK